MITAWLQTRSERAVHASGGVLVLLARLIIINEDIRHVFTLVSVPGPREFCRHASVSLNAADWRTPSPCAREAQGMNECTTMRSSSRPPGVAAQLPFLAIVLHWRTQPIHTLLIHVAHRKDLQGSLGFQKTSSEPVSLRL